MLIDFGYIVRKYGKPTGIIHVGSHMKEERNSYFTQNVTNIVWIEANPYIYSQANISYPNQDNEISINYAISDTDNKIVKLYITSNTQSSSILQLDKHQYYYPDIVVDKTIDVTTKTLDSIISEYRLDIANYNFLNLDIQGSELMALQGFANNLQHMKFIYCEVNISNLYTDCATIEKIDTFLSEHSFVRKETVMTKYEWGDALYVRS